MAEQFQNFYVTKLREACDATATTIYVDTVPAITEGTLVLEYANSTKHEIIHFTGVSGYGLTGCTRGLEGTTAQSHSAGTDVRQNLTAGMIDKIINGVITTENIANSAVTTAKINNGAVTADKIDFTTLTAHTRNNFKMGYGYAGTLIRTGNIVVFTSWGAFNSNITDGQSLAETIPAGFRPPYNFRPQKYFVDNSSTKWVSWQICSNGGMTIHGNVQRNDAVLCYIIWPTNEAMPED